MTNLGPCCICERTGPKVRNVLMLDKRSPHGHGWGCVICGLAAEGASAVICDACAQKPHPYEMLRYYCIPAGENYVIGRAPIADLDFEPVWKHDLSKH